MRRRAWLQGLAVAVMGSVSSATWANAYNTFQTAIIRDDYIAVRKLLQRGMDPNTVDPRGWPALVSALARDSFRVAQVLMDAPGLRVTDANPLGETALMQACIKGDLEFVQQLLAKGARINHPGWAPLHYAASGNHPQSVAIAQLLLDQHAYIDAESPNRSTPLMLAAQYGSQDMVELLLQAGADVHARNELGLGAIDFAQRSEREFMVRLLQRASQAQRSSSGARPTW